MINRKILIIPFHDMDLLAVYISQLIRFGRICSNVSDFLGGAPFVDPVVIHVSCLPCCLVCSS